jgi:phage shock protein PspC (stress-responsive transcriptional regulator)
MDRKLTRKTRSAILGGVAAGFGEYLEIDAVLVRLIFIFLCLAGGSGLIFYLACWLIMPRDDEVAAAGETSRAQPEAPPVGRFAEEVREAGERVMGRIKRSADSPGRGRMIAGMILIAIGLLFLVDQFLPTAWLSFQYLWPLLIIAIGVAILVQGGRRVTDE